MARWANDAVIDALLAAVAAGNLVTVCSAQPTTFAEASTNLGAGGYKLADVTVTPGSGNGSFTIADAVGPATGRTLTVAQLTNILVDASGDATHVAVCNSTSQTLLYVVTCTQQTLTQNNTVTVPAWTINVADPTAP